MSDPTYDPKKDPEYEGSSSIGDENPDNDAAAVIDAADVIDVVYVIDVPAVTDKAYDESVEEEKQPSSQRPANISQESSFGECVSFSTGLSQCISDFDLYSKSVHSSTFKPKRRAFFGFRMRIFCSKA